ncbi:MAG: prepilin-type N-terminal cleavage/methylation domain-containing protein [Candidatus Dadabacteria bacterium]|nr:prepilin-type N-terminal cleavage/methylation domain-containing protein [Candidatus Dadabacteria bacterium]NIQ14986.1 prepilin-type N-terminal cleavage/methylation domain-containing protein [Candidatus Dadabacteria bacterium]
MGKIYQEKGFSLLELIIALGIMAVGFLAMAQMQFLSLRQHNVAQSGTLATNIIQFASDNDLVEIKRRFLLNSQNYIKGLKGLTVSSSPDFCDGTPPSNCPNSPDTCADPCTSCPCNPFTIITSKASLDDDNSTETACAAVKLIDLNSDKLDFKTTASNCTNGEYYIIRQVTTNVIQSTNPVDPDLLQFTITYAVKSPRKFDETGFNLKTKNVLALQNIEISGHFDDWSQYVPTWSNVLVPHIN